MKHINPNELTQPTRKTILIALGEVLFILLLLFVWISCDSIRESKNLFVLFFYSFPAMFLVGLIPHEPAILYFSKFHPVWLVTVVAISATLITESMNYFCLKVFFDLEFSQKYKKSSLVGKLVRLFSTAPFLTLAITAFTPIPFFPFRLLVVLQSYSKFKYLLALFVGRVPRIYLYAYLGQTFKIPDKYLALSFLLILLPVIVRFFKPDEEVSIEPSGKVSITPGYENDQEPFKNP